MMFIVSLVVLLIERFFDWSHLREWRWYIVYQNRIMQSFRMKSPYFTLAMIIVPLLIAVLLIEFILSGWLYGFVRLIFELFIVLYCLGPKNLWADAFSCINAITQADQQIAEDKLKSSFGTDAHHSTSLHHQLLNNIFIDANRRVFAVIFWYVLLGPVGAVLYRTVVLSATDFTAQMPRQDILVSARVAQGLLDWLPVRLLAFIFALGGHFVRVLSCLRKKFLSSITANEDLLTECGLAALSYDDQEKIAEDGSSEKNALSLLDRAFIILLVIIAFIALI